MLTDEREIVMTSPGLAYRLQFKRNAQATHRPHTVPVRKQSDVTNHVPQQYIGKEALLGSACCFLFSFSFAGPRGVAPAHLHFLLAPFERARKESDKAAGLLDGHILDTQSLPRVWRTYTRSSQTESTRNGLRRLGSRPGSRGT